MIAEYLHVVSDPAHILAEITFAVVEMLVGAAIATPFVKRWVRRHDQEVHNT